VYLQHILVDSLVKAGNKTENGKIIKRQFKTEKKTEIKTEQVQQKTTTSSKPRDTGFPAACFRFAALPGAQREPGPGKNNGPLVNGSSLLILAYVSKSSTAYNNSLSNP